MLPLIQILVCWKEALFYTLYDNFVHNTKLKHEWNGPLQFHRLNILSLSLEDEAQCQISSIYAL